MVRVHTFVGVALFKSVLTSTLTRGDAVVGVDAETFEAFSFKAGVKVFILTRPHNLFI